MTTTASTRVTVEVIKDIDGFRALESEWRALYEASPLATPFQTWDWLFTWWEVYGTPGALRLILARDGGRLVGAMPLMTTGRGRLQFIGTGLSDHLDLLVDETVINEVLDSWITYLHRSAGLALIDLHEVRPTAVAWQLYGQWPGRARHYEQSHCAEFDAAALDDVLDRWSKNTRRSARVAMNRIAKGGYTQHWAQPDEIGDMAEELVERHQRMWEGRDITPAHAEPRFARFVRTVCERMALHEEIALVRLDPPDDIDEPMQMTELLVVGREYVGGWLSAHNATAHRRMTIAIVENLHGIVLANSRGIAVMSMLRGLEEGKLKMHERTLVNHRLLFAGGGVRAAALWLSQAAPTAAVVRLKRWEKHSPTGRRVAAWLRNLRDRTRS